MIEVQNNKVFVKTNKLYIIPITDVYNWTLNNDEFLLNISMKELLKVFIYGIPNNLKEYLLKKIRLYDESSKINSFNYDGKDYWLDKLLRASITNLINTSVSTFSDDNLIDIILGESVYLFSPNDLKNLLDSLELYAYKCKVTTLKHLNTISKYPEPTNPEEFKTYVDFISNYDYTSGYPEKIKL